MKKQSICKTITLFSTALSFSLAMQGYSQNNIVFSHDFETSNHGWRVADLGAGRPTQVDPALISEIGSNGLSYSPTSSRYVIARSTTIPSGIGMDVLDTWETTGAHFFYQVAVNANTTYRITAKRLINIEYQSGHDMPQYAPPVSGFSVWDASSGINAINPESNPRFASQDYTNGVWQDIDLTFTTGASTTELLLTSGTYTSTTYPLEPTESVQGGDWYRSLYNALGADDYRDIISDDSQTHDLSSYITNDGGSAIYWENMTANYGLDSVTMVEVVPEPSSVLLLSLAGALSVMRRKRD